MGKGWSKFTDWLSGNQDRKLNENQTEQQKKNTKRIKEILGISEERIKEIAKVKYSETLFRLLIENENNPKSMFSKQTKLMYDMMQDLTTSQKLELFEEALKAKSMLEIQKFSIRKFLVKYFPSTVEGIQNPLQNHTGIPLVYPLVNSYYYAKVEDRLTDNVKTNISKNETKFVDILLSGDKEFLENFYNSDTVFTPELPDGMSLSRETIDGKIMNKHTNFGVHKFRVTEVSKGEPLGVCFEECFKSNQGTCKVVYSKNDSTCYKMKDGVGPKDVFNSTADSVIYSYGR